LAAGLQLFLADERDRCRSGADAGAEPVTTVDVADDIHRAGDQVTDAWRDIGAHQHRLGVASGLCGGLAGDGRDAPADIAREPRGPNFPPSWLNFLRAQPGWRHGEQVGELRLGLERLLEL